MARAGEPAGQFDQRDPRGAGLLRPGSILHASAMPFGSTSPARRRIKAPLKGMGLRPARQKNSKISLFVGGYLIYIPRMENDPSDRTRRVLGITTDTWMFIGQLAGLLALAVALVGLQSLL